MNAIMEFISGLDLRGLSEAAVVLRFVLAAVCGGLIGIEREHKHRPAGFRTHILVCLGAAATTMTGQYLIDLGNFMNLPVVNDPVRLGAQVVSGIGFIGAGSIIVTKRRQVKGLTTAAGLWTAAVVGLSIGVGFYEVALYATFLVLVTETVLSRLDWFLLSHSKNINVYIEYTNAEKLADIMSEIKKRDISVLDIEVAKARAETEHRISAVLCLQINKKTPQRDLLSAISQVEGVTAVEEL